MDEDVVARRIHAAFAAVSPPTAALRSEHHPRRSTAAIVVLSSIALFAIVVLGAVAVWLNSPCPPGIGCALAPPTLAPESITREQAIAAAIRQAPSSMTDPSVDWATAGQNPFEPHSSTPVWLVRLKGSGKLPTCAPGYVDRIPSPSDAPCLDNDLGKAPYGLVVVLDPLTGDLLGWGR
ncbi:MAG: hypothetical protein ABI725_05940 [Chloroflexota bacterium]